MINPLDTDIIGLDAPDVKKIRELILGEDENEVLTKGDIIYIVGGTIPRILCPIIIDDAVVVDMRSVYSPDGKILNKLEYEIRLDTARMVSYSIEDDSKFKEFYIKTLQIIIGGKLRKELVLDTNDLMYLNNVVAIYGVMQYGKYDVMNALDIYPKYLIGLPVDKDNLKEVIADVGGLETIEQMIEVINKLDNVSNRLKKVNKEVLFSAVTTTVFSGAAINLLVGIEIPYVLVALVYTYTNNRLYEKSQFSSMISFNTKLLDLKDNIKKLDRILK